MSLTGADTPDDLLTQLAHLIDQHGPEAFLARPLLNSSVRLSETAWDATLVSLGQMINGVMAWVGLDDRTFEIIDARTPFEAPYHLDTAQPDFSLVGVDGPKLTFQLGRMAAAATMLGAVSYEVAKAFILINSGAAGQPFREAANLDAQHAVDGVRASVAEIYLGLGLVATSTAFTDRVARESRGSTSVRTRNQVVIGALPPGELAYLLAAQLIVRDGGDAEWQRVMEQLTSGLRETVTACRDDLDRDELVARLRLPARSTPAAAPVIAPLRPAMLEALRVADERFARPRGGQTVPRYYKRAFGFWPFGGGVLTIALVLAVGIRNGWIVGAAFPVGMILGFVASRARRSESCGGCGVQINVGAPTCWRCGATLASPAIPHPRPRVAADIEDADDELTRLALAAKSEDDEE